MEHETFFTLIRDPAHWELELFLLLIFDGIIGLLLWPLIKRAFVHHESDDKKIEKLELEVKKIKERIGL
jgi:hypothetical protein